MSILIQIALIILFSGSSCIHATHFLMISINSLLDEMRREREFYKSRNLQCPKDMPQQQQDSDDKANEQAHQEADYHRQDEQVNVCLECISNNLRHLKRRFIRCSSQATITHLKKFLAKKVLNGMERYKDVSEQHNALVELMLNGCSISDRHIVQ